MTTLEGIIGLIASVCAIVGTLVLLTRYMARKFDKWTEAVIENSTVMRSLGARVSRLEKAINGNNDDNGAGRNLN